MKPNETKAALRLLYAVAIADGAVCSEEERALAVAAEDLSNELDRARAVDVFAEAACLTSKEAKLATFEAAVALAAVDGRCAPEEHAVLERMRAALGIDLPLPAVREERWEERLRGARAAMREAERDFLRAVADRREKGLPDREYVSLVEELHRAQAVALHETLDPAFEGRPSYAGP